MRCAQIIAKRNIAGFCPAQTKRARRFALFQASMQSGCFIREN